MTSSTTLRHVGNGSSMGAKAGAMAHRHSVASRKVAVIIFSVLLAFVCFLGMVQVSNQVNGLRSHISVLQDQQEYLEAQGASLLAQWNKVIRSEAITVRAKQELNLQVPDVPALVLVRHGRSRDRSSWKNMFHGLNQSTAAAAEITEGSGSGQVSDLASP